MAGQGGPLRTPPQLPQDPWAALLASLPQPGAPMLPQLPTIGAAPRPAPFEPPTIGPAPAPTAVENWTDPQQLAQALQDLTRGLWSYGTHPAENLARASQGGAQAAQGMWELPVRAPEIAQGLGQAGVQGVAQGMGDYLGERFGSPTQAVQTALQDPVGALFDLPVDPISPGMLAAGVAAAPARGFRLPASAAIKTQKAAGVKGLYSRSVKAAQQLPERVNVQSVLNALQRFGAPPEELKLTRLAESLPRTGQVAREDVIRTLEANLPKLEAGERIKATRVSKETREFLQSRQIPIPENRDEWSKLWRQLQEERNNLPPISNAEEDAVWTSFTEAATEARRIASRLQSSRRGRRNYEQYTLRGGHDYQETLLTADPLPTSDASQWSAGAYLRSADLPDLASGEEWRMPTMGYVVRDPFGNPVQTVYAQDAQDAIDSVLKAKGGGTYRGGHWSDTPNVLMHTRTKTRRLAESDAPVPFTPATVDDPAFLEWHRNEWGYYSPDRDPGGENLRRHLRDYNNERQAEVVKAASTQGPEGHFVEEIQSDWIHEGQREGFRKPLPRQDMVEGLDYVVRATSPEGMIIPFGPVGSKEAATKAAAELHARGYRVEVVPNRMPAQQRALQGLDEQIEVLRDKIEELTQRDATTWPYSPEGAAIEGERQTLSSQLSQLYGERDVAQRQMREASQAGGSTPQPPYEKEWENIALKRELLKAADEGAEWFGMTSGKTQADRYNLLNYVDTVTYDPATQSLLAFKDGEQIASHTVEATKLADYVGADVAKQLLAAQTDSVKPKGSRVDWEYSEDAAQQSVERLRAENPNRQLRIEARPGNDATGERWDIWEDAEAVSAPHVLRGEQLSVGNQHLQRLYDEQLPRKLQKIVEKVGGKVERGLVRVTAGKGTEPAWIVRLPPELRKRLLTEGLPLMSLAPFLAAELRGGGE